MLKKNFDLFIFKMFRYLNKLVGDGSGKKKDILFKFADLGKFRLVKVSLG